MRITSTILRRSFASAILAVSLLACDKKNSDLVLPLTAEAFPQVILFSEEGDGELEDSDEFSVALTLADRSDPEGKELAGTVVPLSSDVIVSFEIKEWEGIDPTSGFIKNVTALYEIDDCTTSEDQGIDLNLGFDIATGKGSVRFPKEVQEIEIVFETDEDLLNDTELNDEERSLTLVITGVSSAAGVTYNSAAEFKYESLDDEGIQSEWELDHEDPIAFAAFKALFGAANEDISELNADDIEKIEFNIEYDEVTIVVELKETEIVTECGVSEEVNKIIEIETDLEEIETLTDSGEIEFAGEFERADGSNGSFVMKGEFIIDGTNLTLVLTPEYDGEEADEITLPLSK